MIDVTKIQEHMPVSGSDGGHVGTVDHLDGQRINVDSIEAVENGEVRLNRTAAQAKDEWGTAE
jgi:hypothetical protein